MTLPPNVRNILAEVRQALPFKNTKTHRLSIKARHMQYVENKQQYLHSDPESYIVTTYINTISNVICLNVHPVTVLIASKTCI